MSMQALAASSLLCVRPSSFRPLSFGSKVSSVEEMRQMDARAESVFGIPSLILMENASLASCQVAVSLLGGEAASKKVSLLCGPGNNGGDGLAMARKLSSLGGQVTVILSSDPSKYKGDALVNFKIVQRIPDIVIQEAFLCESSLHEGLLTMESSDLVVDALFGTGLSREIASCSVAGRLILKSNELLRRFDEGRRGGVPVLAIDIPSGVCGDSGKLVSSGVPPSSGSSPLAVRASATVTFGLPKWGNLLYPGSTKGGKLYLTHIGFPKENYKDVKTQLTSLPFPLPPRDPEGHKGTFGSALFISGSSQYFGAPYLAASAFLKAGGGYARLGSTPEVIKVVAGRGVGVVFHALDGGEGVLTEAHGEALLEVAQKQDFVVLGPGLGLHPSTCALVKCLAPEIERPLLLDGDALTVLSQLSSEQKQHFVEARKQRLTVLTPHPGELARLAGEPTRGKDQRALGEIGRRVAQEFDAVVVVKGARSLVVPPPSFEGSRRDSTFVNVSGCSGLGSAGSGDVLTGVIAACFCHELNAEKDTSYIQDLEAAEEGTLSASGRLLRAVRRGVWVHGLSGEVAGREGEDGVGPEGILKAVPIAMRSERSWESLPEDVRSKYDAFLWKL